MIFSVTEVRSRSLYYQVSAVEKRETSRLGLHTCSIFKYTTVYNIYYCVYKYTVYLNTRVRNAFTADVRVHSRARETGTSSLTLELPGGRND